MTSSFSFNGGLVSAKEPLESNAHSKLYQLSISSDRNTHLEMTGAGFWITEILLLYDPNRLYQPSIYSGRVIQADKAVSGVTWKTKHAYFSSCKKFFLNKSSSFKGCLMIVRKEGLPFILEMHTALFHLCFLYLVYLFFAGFAIWALYKTLHK